MATDLSPDKRREDELVELYARASADHFKECHGCGGGAHKAGLLAVFASAASHVAPNEVGIPAFDLPITEERIASIVGERFHEGPASESYRKARKAVWACLHHVSRALSAPSTTRRITRQEAVTLFCEIANRNLHDAEVFNLTENFRTTIDEFADACLALSATARSEIIEECAAVIERDHRFLSCCQDVCRVTEAVRALKNRADGGKACSCGATAGQYHAAGCGYEGVFNG